MIDHQMDDEGWLERKPPLRGSLLYAQPYRMASRKLEERGAPARELAYLAREAYVYGEISCRDYGAVLKRLGVDA